ncbi:FAD-dependent oxidoreductase [Nocardioides sp. zg-579]|uniref:FAD-dependent oxidoreductase n=1 Tax=Nocardioides marmotae TaxID=2663857 RepID=A0A6I3JBT6_9ACTN|nr:NAD(P)/FAD-dependent oxidoreductase [Nocardioides marmotae]MCR6031947.1 FAD-dependent oxidoreductase [Gordonia jinghuaiqii]MTB95587.1 FAD-dependent oxidoreductase [Nocardioides marmotae]QKE01007.1 NAD(P)/FAD-dependent oxidoreductase [Nocardioides marmotae]
MARVVVVGGGFAGLAAAARLAKLGHEVTLLERSATLGGALGRVEADGFTWDAGPSWTTLPAVVRDLFRKSGRPVERELDLVPLDVVREHRFADGTSVRVPPSRAGQVAAFDALGPGLGQRWAEHVASYTEVWETLRREYLEVPWDPAAPSRELAALLDSRQTMHRLLRRRFKDERLALVAGHPAVAEGHDLRNVPAWAGVTAYVEQRFGAWTVEGGMARLADALTARLATRGVTVRTGTTVRDLVVRGGRVVAVDLGAGETLDADVVVVAVDPRLLPTLAPLVARTMPAIPPVVAHLGLEGEVPDLPHELVLHGDPLLVVRTGGGAPEGSSAWTVHGRGKLAEDLLRALARHRIDVRANVVTRLDRTPRDLVERWGGSPLGVVWQGRSTVRRRLGPTTPVAGVYAAGAHATPGAGLPYVGLSAALVAQAIGPA